MSEWSDIYSKHCVNASLLKAKSLEKQGSLIELQNLLDDIDSRLEAKNKFIDDECSGSWVIYEQKRYESKDAHDKEQAYLSTLPTDVDTTYQYKRDDYKY